MDRFIPILYIAGWFTAFFTISYLINWLLIRSIIRHYYRFFVAPGIIVHELSHAVGCLITGCQILEINFWKPSGGHVKHTTPTHPIAQLITNPIIALAPIWGALIILILLTKIMQPNLFNLIYNADLTMISRSIRQDWISLIYFYLVTSLVATMAPSSTDIRYALTSLISLTIILGFLIYIPGFSPLLQSWGENLQPLAIFSLVILGLSLFIAFLLALPNRHKHFKVKPILD